MKLGRVVEALSKGVRGVLGERNSAPKGQVLV